MLRRCWRTGRAVVLAAVSIAVVPSHVHGQLGDAAQEQGAGRKAGKRGGTIAGQVTAKTDNGFEVQRRAPRRAQAGAPQPEQAQTVKVTTTEETKFILYKEGKVEDLKTDQLVFIYGVVKGNSVAAKAILVGPQGIPIPLVKGGKASQRAGQAEGKSVASTITDTNPLTVKSNDGNDTKVETTADTKVVVLANGTLADVAVGSKVMVTGKPKAEGEGAANPEIEARTVRVYPPGMKMTGFGQRLQSPRRGGRGLPPAPPAEAPAAPAAPG